MAVKCILGHMAKTTAEKLPRFLTVPEYAELVRSDPRTVRRGIAAGEIPAVQFGRIVRIPVEALAAHRDAS